MSDSTLETSGVTTSAEDGFSNGSVQGWMRQHAGWLCVWMLLLLVALVLGLNTGSLTSADAPFAWAVQTVINPVLDPPTNLGAEHHVAGWILQTVGLDVTPIALRTLNILGVLGCLIACGWWMSRLGGCTSASFSMLLAGCSLPVVMLVHQATADAWFALSLILLTQSLAAMGSMAMNVGKNSSPKIEPEGKPHNTGLTIARLALGILGGVGVWMFFQTPFPALFGNKGHDTVLGDPNDPWVAPIRVACLLLPMVILLFPIVQRSFWKALGRWQKPDAIAALGLLAFCLFGSALAPWRIEGWAMAGSVGLAVLAVQSWKLAESLDAKNRLQPLIVQTLNFYIVAVPTATMLWAVIRIGSVFNVMERVQVAFVVGMFALLVALMFRKANVGLALRLAPVVAVAIAWNIVMTFALVPEAEARDQQRPWINAVARRLPQNARLRTDLPLSASDRFYLNRPSARLTRAKAIASDDWLLVRADQMPMENPTQPGSVPRAFARRPINRVFIGPIGKRVYLLAPPTGPVSQPTQIARPKQPSRTK